MARRFRLAPTLAIACLATVAFQPVSALAQSDACTDGEAQNTINARMREWLAALLPSKVASDMQKTYYKTRVDDAMVDPNPPGPIADDRSNPVLHCTLKFSATVYDDSHLTLGNLNGLEHIEIRSVPYTSGHGLDLDLPPVAFQLNQLTPAQKRLIGSFYYRGQQLYPALASQPVAAGSSGNMPKIGQVAGSARIATTSRSRVAKPSPQPQNAVAAYKAMFASVGADYEHVMRAQGLGAYVDKMKKPLTPAQRANLNRKIKACENAGGTWGTPTYSGSFMPSGPEGCYFMQVHP